MNVGHLDIASGVTGLINVAQALLHEQLPPAINFTSPNPNIDLANSPFYVNKQLAPWRNGAAPAPGWRERVWRGGHERPCGS